MEMIEMKFGQMTNPATWGALVLTAMLVQGCDQPGAPASSTRLYAVDQAGAAKVCNASKVQPANGQVTDVAMTMANDGGWCGTLVAQSGRPYSAGLLTIRAKNGKVYVHVVGDETRIDYTPNTGFTGNDSFTVKLVPGDASVRVNVAISK